MMEDLLRIDDPVLKRMFHAGSPAYTDKRMKEFLRLLPYFRDQLSDRKSHVTRQLLVTICAMLRNREQYCPQKTGRTLTASQFEKLLKLRARQYGKLCLQASQAGVSALQLTEISQSNSVKAVYL